MNSLEVPAVAYMLTLISVSASSAAKLQPSRAVASYLYVYAVYIVHAESSIRRPHRLDPQQLTLLTSNASFTLYINYSHLSLSMPAVRAVDGDQNG